MEALSLVMGQVVYLSEHRVAGRWWRDSETICAFCDRDRHLGHIIRANGWVAFDATRPSPRSGGFLRIGRYETAELARRAVERSVAAFQLPLEFAPTQAVERLPALAATS
jgi:hypothetical protein